MGEVDIGRLTGEGMVDMLKKMDQEGRGAGYRILLEGYCTLEKVVAGGMFDVWDPS